MIVINRWIYRFFVRLYLCLAYFYALFDKKAKKFVDGRRYFFSKTKVEFDKNDIVVWFHAASLGEFEQGRPLIEKIKKEQPQIKIVLSFFSPSGYEQRKEYPSADLVCYLPMDHPVHAERFIELIRPAFAVFIKYEFWYFYFKHLKDKNIPLFMLSSVFRENQLFFKSFAPLFREILGCVTHFFVQDKESADILKAASFHNVTIAPDSRIDRVFDIRKEADAFRSDVIEKFLDKSFCLILGSSYKMEEEFASTFIKKTNYEGKLIIAPHQPTPKRIGDIESTYPYQCVRYSDTHDKKSLKDAKVMIIDSIGLLNRLYKYADIALIGGGFNKGVHNTLEAAVFGVPVIFGPKNHKKFPETLGLISSGGGFLIKNNNDCLRQIDFLLHNENRKKAGENAFSFIQNNRGGTEKVYSFLSNYYKPIDDMKDIKDF